MIRNYIKTAWRSLTYHRTYSLTNLVGLTLGLVVVLLIATRVLDELSYDQHWSRKDELYRVRTHLFDKDGNVLSQLNGAPEGLAQAWVADFPEIAGQAPVELVQTRLMLDSTASHYAELTMMESDTGFFNLFDIQLVDGNPRHVFAHAKNLAITESAHQRFFGGKPVVGKIFYNIPNHDKAEPFVIQAIVRDLPRNTHLHADAIVVVPQTSVYQPGARAGGARGQYLLLQPGTDTTAMNAKLNAWYRQKESADNSQSRGFFLQSVKDVHLRSTTGWESPMRDIYLFSGIGLLILVLVSINFVNLTFAHAVKRTAETGVRKVLGAGRRHFLYQLGAESMLLFGLSLLFAFILYIAAFAPLEAYFGHALTFGFHRSPAFFFLLAVSWLALGLLCSLFPAMALSKTKVSQGLKKQLFVLRLPMNTGFTKGLVAIQFSIAIVVMVCMLTIRAQLKYMDTKDLGYQPDNLIAVDYSLWEGKSEAFKQNLLQHPAIQSVSLSYWTPFMGWVDFAHIDDPENPGNTKLVAVLYGDFDYVKTLGLRVVEGRELHPDFALDGVAYGQEGDGEQLYSNVLASESAASHFNLELDRLSAPLKRTPVGIIQDFHAASLRFPISDIVVEAHANLDQGACMLIRTIEGGENDALAALNATWKQFFPGTIMPRTHQVAEQVRAQYLEERRQYQQLAFFGAISMLIALLGVLGLAIYTIERRVKEIGIRKVLGASVRSIVALLSASFAKPVFVAIALAFPVAWWAMRKWLDNFAYRIEMPLLVFVFAGLFALCCMFLVVGGRALRSAKANPVESLRDE